MNNPRHFTTLWGRTKAPTTAASPKHAEPVHLHMRPQRQRLASNARLNLLVQAQAMISRATALYPSLYPSLHIVLPFNEPT
jgi:hypothetical protein